MFQDVDETIRAHLETDVPIDRSEVDISFERPTREWSARLVRPTLNAFLFDIRERVDFRDDTWRVRTQSNGKFERTRGPRRIDLSYILSAWTKEPADEHRILGRVLPAMYRTAQFPESALQGVLAQADVPVLGRVMTSEHVAKPADLWGVLDNELRATLTWVLTVPLDVFAAQDGPLVTTSTILTGPTEDGELRERFVRVGGIVQRKGKDGEVIPGAKIQVLGSTSLATSGADGEFVFDSVAPGKQKWRVEAPGKKPVEIEVEVPAAGYVIEV